MGFEAQPQNKRNPLNPKVDQVHSCAWALLLAGAPLMALLLPSRSTQTISDKYVEPTSTGRKSNNNVHTRGLPDIDTLMVILNVSYKIHMHNRKILRAVAGRDGHTAFTTLTTHLSQKDK